VRAELLPMGVIENIHRDPRHILLLDKMYFLILGFKVVLLLEGASDGRVWGHGGLCCVCPATTSIYIHAS